MSKTESFRIPDQIAKMLANAAQIRGITKSELLKEIVTSNITNYEELTRLERQYAQLKARQRKDTMEKALAHEKMKEATFLNYLKATCKKLKYNGANRDELVEICHAYMGIAERRDKLAELEDWINKLEDQSSWIDWENISYAQ